MELDIGRPVSIYSTSRMREHNLISGSAAKTKNGGRVPNIVQDRVLKLSLSNGRDQWPISWILSLNVALNSIFSAYS